MEKSLVTITYKTANGNKICVEVSTPVKELLEQSDRQIRSQRRQDRRHLDFAVRTDESFSDFLLPAYEDTADLLIRMERDAKLHEAIGKLTEVQRRRLRLYYFKGFSYSRIARLEGVSCQTVVGTIEQALRRLQKLCRK
ncbi:RNA polymerase sigma factor [Caproiciproducens galactitolivorans]|uniref:Sigma-70 family RNA polymerase sigma factor n=1 Tax=Caproiciproducens galactitolivorans TaxID=642589 RepID=A0ABT4BVD8_9FIRM|nr:sigma-70 family RNA polymerase sigma factor [Caproiciproducens galactitolivorans]MCY1714860.1 sigma-70 family RNA polymerase sigma factor [Caproiciproducens galactitolivorans]